MYQQQCCVRGDEGVPRDPRGPKDSDHIERDKTVWKWKDEGKKVDFVIACKKGKRIL